MHRKIYRSQLWRSTVTCTVRSTVTSKYVTSLRDQCIVESLTSESQPAKYFTTQIYIPKYVPKLRPKLGFMWSKGISAVTTKHQTHIQRGPERGSRKEVQKGIQKGLVVSFLSLTHRKNDPVYEGKFEDFAKFAIFQ